MSVWEASIAGSAFVFRSTDGETAALYRSRIVDGAGGGTGAVAFRFDLIETERVGWPPPGSWAIWRERPESLDRAFASERLATLRPVARSDGYPWVFFDPASGHGVILVRTVDDLPPWTAGAPFGLLFHLAYAWKGWRLLHGATLGLGDCGVLLAGAGGTGKSATALAGVRAGLGTVGDDYVILEPGPVPRAWPLYRLFKQSPAGLGRFPGLPPALVDGPVNWHGKVEFDPEPVFPGCFATTALALRAIVLPEMSRGAGTAFGRVRPAEAFSPLAASVMAQLPGARLAGFSLLTRLTRLLPAFRAQLSSDPAEIGSAFTRFLAEQARCALP